MPVALEVSWFCPSRIGFQGKSESTLLGETPLYKVDAEITLLGEAPLYKVDEEHFEPA